MFTPRTVLLQKSVLAARSPETKNRSQPSKIRPKKDNTHQTWRLSGREEGDGKEGGGEGVRRAGRIGGAPGGAGRLRAGGWGGGAGAAENAAAARRKAARDGTGWGEKGKTAERKGRQGGGREGRLRKGGGGGGASVARGNGEASLEGGERETEGAVIGCRWRLGPGPVVGRVRSMGRAGEAGGRAGRRSGSNGKSYRGERGREGKGNSDKGG